MDLQNYLFSLNLRFKLYHKLKKKKNHISTITNPQINLLFLVIIDYVMFCPFINHLIEICFLRLIYVQTVHLTFISIVDFLIILKQKNS